VAVLVLAVNGDQIIGRDRDAPAPPRPTRRVPCRMIPLLLLILAPPLSEICSARTSTCPALPAPLVLVCMTPLFSNRTVEAEMDTSPESPQSVQMLLLLDVMPLLVSPPPLTRTLRAVMRISPA